MIPFTVTIPTEQQDKNLGAKLKKELPGILAWAVEGCKLWQKEGLTPPPTMQAAVQAYGAPPTLPWEQYHTNGSAIQPENRA